MRSDANAVRRARIAVALLWATLSPAAIAGTLSPELETILQTTPPTQKVPVILPMSVQVDPDESAGARSEPAERLTEIVTALKTLATATQDAPACGRPGLVTELTDAGPEKASNIRRLWVVNAVVVDATPDVIRSCGTRVDVGEVHFAGNRTTDAPPEEGAVPQWNIAHVGAPPAWALGFTGVGGIVASIDTGADAGHPDLAPNLLRDTSNLPIWHDAVSGQSAPYDDDGHGTHLLGVAVGQNGYGVAPGAKWMSCKAFTRSGTLLVTNAARILECAEWILNPLHSTLGDSTPPDAAYLPDAVLSDLVISAAGYCDPFLRDVVRVWRAARILPVWSVGDDPNIAPVGAVPSPANDPAVFSVGAADENDAILPTTFRGLAFCPGPVRMAPRLVAPGINVTAAWPGGQHMTRRGSDVAAAHVAGAAALVRGARPDLRLVPVDLLDEALERTGVSVSGGQRRLDVNAAVRLEDAAFNGWAPPPPLTTGQTVTVTVAMQNRGVTSWTSGTYTLTYVGGGMSSWGVSQVSLPVSKILPGEEVAFTFNVTAPMVPGIYPFEWQVCNGSTCFGTPTDEWLVPVAGVDGATFVSQTVPCLQPGQSGSASVTFRNTGTTTWTNPDYALGKWGTYSDPQLVNLAAGQTVAPNATVTFTFSFQGPLPTARYTFQRQMRKGGTWFGEAGSTYSIDTYTCTPDDGSFTFVFPPPGEMRAGASSTATAMARNVGLTTWIANYCLQVYSTAFGGALSSCLTSPTTVGPTYSRLFSVPVVAQSAEPALGRWPLTIRMYDNTGAGFGPTWSSTVGIPRDHQGSGEFASVQGFNNWFYRFYSPTTNTWKKMTWKPVPQYWEGSGSLQIIGQASVHPGPGHPVARFWKSPVSGWVRASASVTDLDPSCGDGVIVRLRKNTGLLAEWTIANGGSASINKEVSVAPNDTLRFIVLDRANSNCDSTRLDPLVQVLPPAHPNTGPVPAEGPVVNTLYEAAGYIP